MSLFRLASPQNRRASISLALLAASLSSTILSAATLSVTTLTDVQAIDALCSLREAIVAANTDAAFSDCQAGSGEDRIDFAVSGTIEIASDLPVVTSSLVIAGPGVANLVIDGNFHRLLRLDGEPDGARLEVANLVLRRGGNPESGGCLSARRDDILEIHDARVLLCGSQGAGGGIAGDGAALVRVVRTRVANNIAIAGGGGIALLGDPDPEIGGAVGGGGPRLVIEDSTVSSNEIPLEGAAGGGIGVALAALELRRSTVSANRTFDLGGGIFAIASELTLESSTIYGNIAQQPPPRGGGHRGSEVGGGGVALIGLPTSPSTATIRNSIVAGNLSGTDVNDLLEDAFTTLTSLGWNAIGVNEGAVSSFPSGLPNLFEDWVGTTSVPLDAGLGPLVANGGPTFTRLPLAGSVVIDRGSCPEERRDQRGYGEALTGDRPVDTPNIDNAHDGCDIGAVEAGSVELPLILFLDGFESANFSAWSATVP